MIFSDDLTSFSFIATPLKSDRDLYSGLWLLLVGINNTPPHIALIYNGKYYSVSARNIDCGTPAKKFLNIIHRKNISTLCVGIQVPEKDFETLLNNLYTNYKPLSDSNNSCLSPIKEFFAGNISPEFASVNYVFELVALVETKGLVKECHSLFCKFTISNVVTLPKYTMVQIKNRIKELSSPDILI